MRNSAAEENLGMVVVMGVTGAGKSYLINKLAGFKAVQEGARLDSCTQKCQLIPAEIGRSRVLLMDTPGFDDTERTDSEILTEIAKILSAQYELGVQLKGVIYIHRITDIRFTRTAVKTFEIFKKVCGEKALKNVLLVTSRWAEVDENTGADRERQLREKFWAYMIGRGSNMSRFYGDRDSAISLVSQLVAKDNIVLDIQRELVEEGKTLDQTVAGAYVSDSIDAMKQKYQEELDSLEKLKQELLDNDRAMKRQIQRDWENERARLRSAEEQQASLQTPVGSQVRDQIGNAEKKKKRNMLPFLPAALSMLSMFVGIPMGSFDTIASWFSGTSFDISSIADLISSVAIF